jgi:hypothetical protein
MSSIKTICLLFAVLSVIPVVGDDNKTYDGTTAFVRMRETELGAFVTLDTIYPLSITDRGTSLYVRLTGNKTVTILKPKELLQEVEHAN